MAYAAVTSLRYTIRRFLRSDDDDIQIVQNSSPEMIQLVEQEAISLADVLQDLDTNTKRFSISKRLNALDAQITEAVFELEDLLEFHLLHQFVSQSQNICQHPFLLCLELDHLNLFSIDIEELKQDIDSLIQRVNKIKAEYIYELTTNNNLPKQEEEDDDHAEEEDVIVKTEPTVFGSNKLLMRIKDWILRRGNAYGPPVIHGSGMAGMSKTTLASKVFEDPSEYIYELSSNNLPDEEKEGDDDDDDEEEDEEEEVIVKTEQRIFGSDKLFMEIKDSILRDGNTYRPFFILGMAGIGKTTLARKVFEDPSVSSHYNSRAFVTVGPQYQLEDVLLDILKQLAPSTSIDDDEEIVKGNYEEILDGLNECLKDLKCLVVLDDVWDKEMTKLNCFDIFRNNRNCLLVTSRLGNSSRYNTTWEIPFLDKKESWDLLCAKLFGEDESLCPSELKRDGKKIAENCEGLPLTIVTVANILSKHEMTPELWNKVADNKQHCVYKEAYAKMHKVLLPSYYCLPQHLRISFLYMGLFPQNYEIPCTKLHMLWKAEGFIDLEENMASVRRYHFGKLRKNRVLVVPSSETIWDDHYKIVGLHSSFWYLCKKEAAKIKFFYSFTTLNDCLPQGIDTQRRLCIYNPVLFAIKDAFDKMASVSAARSLLCTGVYHQYPIPVCFGMRLLRVLYALPIHFYEFPMEVLKLSHLTYFALTCDGDLPASISKLWNLMYLIVDRRLSIKSSPSYLPVEIWDMKKLAHLQVMGSDLPEPPQGSHVKLLKLSKLLDVSPHSCTKTILKRFPNLTKLGIRIELSPDDAVHQPLGCLDHMSRLRSFKCLVVNPRIMFEVPPIPLPIFPKGLVQLTLSGLGYAWEEMTKISSLPKLRVLKLLSYAFRGPKWDVQYREFPSLEVLVIEETDLVQWTTKDDYRIENLECLSIKHCYKLKEIPRYLSVDFHKIEVVDCNPLVVRSANKLKEDGIHSLFGFSVHSSWDDRRLT